MPWNQIETAVAAKFECIGKGKARKPYEFGVKSAVVVAHQHGLMLGARTFPGNPYDGHILSAVLEQATNLTQDVGLKIKHIVVDLGFRGVDADNPDRQIIHRGKFKSLSKQQKGWLKRRTAVEPAIGHLKSDHRMDRCWLKGSIGDALHSISCAAGYKPALAAARHCPPGHRGGLFASVAGSAVTATGRREVIRCVWARVHCDYEQLDRKRGRQKIDFWSRRAGCSYAAGLLCFALESPSFALRARAASIQTQTGGQASH